MRNVHRLNFGVFNLTEISLNASNFLFEFILDISQILFRKYLKMNSSIASGFNAQLLDEQFHLWLDDPTSVDPTWAAFFEGFSLGMSQSGKESIESNLYDFFKILIPTWSWFH